MFDQHYTKPLDLSTPVAVLSGAEALTPERDPLGAMQPEHALAAETRRSIANFLAVGGHASLAADVMQGADLPKRQDANH